MDEDEWPPRRARTSEDWDAYWARQRWDRRFIRKVVKPRWGRLTRKLRAPREGLWIARSAAHRARHGWAARDTWGLDSYLCQLIGEAVAHLRDTTHGFPDSPDLHNMPQMVRSVSLSSVDLAEDEEPGYTRWKAILTAISEPLLAYRDREDLSIEDIHASLEREKKSIEEAQDALRLMADWLPALWD